MLSTTLSKPPAEKIDQDLLLVKFSPQLFSKPSADEIDRNL